MRLDPAPRRAFATATPQKVRICRIFCFPRGFGVDSRCVARTKAPFSQIFTATPLIAFPLSGAVSGFTWTIEES